VTLDRPSPGLSILPSNHVLHQSFILHLTGHLAHRRSISVRVYGI